MEALAWTMMGTVVGVIMSLQVTVLINQFRILRKSDEFLTLLYDLELTVDDLADDVWQDESK